MFLIPLSEYVEYVLSISISPLNKLLNVLHSLLTLSIPWIIKMHNLGILYVVFVHSDNVLNSFSVLVACDIVSTFWLPPYYTLHSLFICSSTILEGLFGECAARWFAAGWQVFEVGVAGLGLPTDSHSHEFSIIRVSKNCNVDVVYTDMVYQASNEEVALLQLVLQGFESRFLLSQGKIIHSKLVLVTLHHSSITNDFNTGLLAANLPYSWEAAML